MQNLIVTDAGLAALINAQHSGTTPIVITHLKLGSAKWRADASATNLKNVTKTFDVQYGGTVDAHTIQVAAIDQSEEQYVAYEMGIFTKDGTLFAIATSNSDPIIQKHASSINEIFCRIVVRSANDGDLQVGDGNLTFLIPQASETAAGIVQFATPEEVKAGTDATRAITPKALKDAGFITATETANLTRLGLTLIPSVPTVTKTEVTFPAMSRIRLADGTEHVLSVQTSVNMKVQASERHGKDVYVWAGLDKAASGDLKLVTSLNAATFSELDKAVCIGGFHGLCKDVGSIENHALSGYVAGDILPRSIWTVNHRPVCAPEGCVWIPEIGKWVQIYLPSWDGTKLVSKFGAVIADGGSEPNFNGSKFAEYAGLAGCELISYDEFTVAAKGSNEGTSIKGAADPNTTGGHVDTADRRCVSNYGLEDCCGVLWQWTRTLFENVPTAAYTNTELVYLEGYSWQEKPIYNETYDSVKMGSCFGLLRRARVGARWDDGVRCGSRAVYCDCFSAFGWTDISSRLVSSPKPLPVLGKESNR